MSWSFEQVMHTLGSKAEVVAGGVKVVDRVVDAEGNVKLAHKLVGRFEGMSFILTQEGEELLSALGEADIVDAEIVSTKPKRGKKHAVVVEDSNEIVDDIDIDLE